MLGRWFRSWWTLRTFYSALSRAKGQNDHGLRLIARELTARAEMLTIQRNTLYGGAKIPWLVGRLEQDMAMRHRAIAAGARSEDDPRWLAATLLETWTQLILIDEEGRGDHQRIREAEDALAAFVATSEPR